MGTIFGANWRTTLSGLVTVLCSAVAFKPELINFIPNPAHDYIAGICGLIAFLSGGAFALTAKDKQVTGGSTQQDKTGEVARPQAATPEPPNPAVPQVGSKN